MPHNTVLTRIDGDLDAALDRLMTLLAIPSISTDKAYKADCDAAADWLVRDLGSIGFEASKRETPGHPMVVAHGGPAPVEGIPHLLFYGHYDVQPVDPLSLWDTPPFEPKLEDTDKGRVIRARGSSDDKGQLMTFIEAMRAWVATHGALPCRITIFLEGEEESGSPSLVPFLKENAEELKADIAMICDTGLFDGKTPAIVTQLRGLLAEEITIRAATRDLHSGFYGGMAANPIHVLSRICADLRDDNGGVTLPGFYDDVPELAPELKAQWEALDFDPDHFLRDVGLSVPAGEKDRTTLERMWSRPTAEVNGITGGYTGDGFKTVLPAEASAKISFRLVGQQDPEKIHAAFVDFVNARLPEDVTCEFSNGHGAPASVMSTSDPAFEKARQALSEEWGTEAAFVGAGGSIPVAGHFKEILGMDAMLIGFAKDDDRIHSPNEKYDLASFHKGMRSWARILSALTPTG
ncbi:dipeptidase [Maritimibacter sp. DP1N21-5]|uniref:dipeptidase n=1 Tax=Maritimibacter sp. DP1N21-5 TaxID=2836867 RepID=UPI001C45A3AD|nr:dipeptidase [Maritimibacter sp. DP1N21-5]MBV7409737.1 dipeptidase [Maritimibacter sp. DP1N21-5]